MFFPKNVYNKNENIYKKMCGFTKKYYLCIIGILFILKRKIMITSKTVIETKDEFLRKAMYEVFGGKCFYTGRDLKFEKCTLTIFILNLRVVKI